MSKAKVSYVYQYGEGRTAYFIKGEEGRATQVYFVEKGIMYQLMVKNSADGTELAKKIVDCMAGLK